MSLVDIWRQKQKLEETEVERTLKRGIRKQEQKTFLAKFIKDVVSTSVSTAKTIKKVQADRAKLQKVATTMSEDLPDNFEDIKYNKNSNSWVLQGVDKNGEFVLAEFSKADIKAFQTKLLTSPDLTIKDFVLNKEGGIRKVFDYENDTDRYNAYKKILGKDYSGVSAEAAEKIGIGIDKSSLEVGDIKASLQTAVWDLEDKLNISSDHTRFSHSEKKLWKTGADSYTTRWKEATNWRDRLDLDIRRQTLAGGKTWDFKSGKTIVSDRTSGPAPNPYAHLSGLKTIQLDEIVSQEDQRQFEIDHGEKWVPDESIVINNEKYIYHKPQGSYIGSYVLETEEDFWNAWQENEDWKSLMEQSDQAWENEQIQVDIAQQLAADTPPDMEEVLPSGWGTSQLRYQEWVNRKDISIQQLADGVASGQISFKNYKERLDFVNKVQLHNNSVLDMVSQGKATPESLINVNEINKRAGINISSSVENLSELELEGYSDKKRPDDYHLYGETDFLGEGTNVSEFQLNRAIMKGYRKNPSYTEGDFTIISDFSEPSESEYIEWQTRKQDARDKINLEQETILQGISDQYETGLEIEKEKELQRNIGIKKAQKKRLIATRRARSGPGLDDEGYSIDPTYGDTSHVEPGPFSKEAIEDYEATGGRMSSLKKSHDAKIKEDEYLNRMEINKKWFSDMEFIDSKAGEIIDNYQPNTKEGMMLLRDRYGTNNVAEIRELISNDLMKFEKHEMLLNQYGASLVDKSVEELNALLDTETDPMKINKLHSALSPLLDGDNRFVSSDKLSQYTPNRNSIMYNTTVTSDYVLTEQELAALEAIKRFNRNR